MAQHDRRKQVERRVEEIPAKPGGLRIRLVAALMLIAVVVVAALFLIGVRQIDNTYSNLERASATYMECERAASKLREASRNLTYDVRTYVVTQNESVLDDYFDEVLVKHEREQAVSTIEKNATNQAVLDHLEQAHENSQKLEEDEIYAIRLTAAASGHDLSAYEDALAAVHLSESDLALSNSAKVSLATERVFGESYTRRVRLIIDDIDACRDLLMTDLSAAQAEGYESMRGLLFRQQVITWVFLAVVVTMIVLVVTLIIRPVRRYIERMKDNNSLPVTGATELRALALAYNIMYEENMKNADSLRRRAEHDHMTGLYNRSVFEKLLEVYSNEPFCLLLIDGDYFKQINDTLGHDGGDAMLKKIARLLDETFRSSDHPCRIGGDEFAVIMTGIDDSLKDVVRNKVKTVSDGLQDTSDGLPPMTLSVGAAFNDGTLSAEQIFKNADQALYSVKEAGRNGFAFYE